MKLTQRQREVLTIMRDHPDSDAGELVCATPGGWWLGWRPVGGKTGFALLRYVLIGGANFDTRMMRYRINSDGIRALDDPNFDVSLEARRN